MSNPRKRERQLDTRHGSGSSSVGSWRSHDTLSRHNRRRRSSNNRFLSDHEYPSALDGTISSTFRSSSPGISPTDRRRSYGFGNYRKALAMVGDGESGASSGGRSPHSDTASALQDQGTASSPNMHNQGTFYQDSSEFETSPDLDDDIDAVRRPSVATVSSQGSKSSGGRFRKQLQGVFGEEFQGPGGIAGQNISHRIPSVSSRTDSTCRGRNGSTHSASLTDRTLSPTSSRPRSPLPSSEVTPWEYQHFKDIPNMGEAPVRQAPTDPNNNRYPGPSDSPRPRPSHRLHLPGHRHTRSKEENGNATATYSSRPSSGRDDASISSRQHKDNGPTQTPTGSSTTLGARSASPTPSTQSGKEQRGQRSPGAPPQKRTFLDKIRRTNKDKSTSSLKQLPSSSRSLQESTTRSPKYFAEDTVKPPKLTPSEISTKSPKYFAPEVAPPPRDRNGSFEFTSRQWDNIDYDRKKDYASKGIQPSKLRHGRVPFGHDETPRRGTFQGDKVYLDTNLGDMSGIVTQQHPVSPTDTGGIFTGAESEPKEKEPQGTFDPTVLDDWHPPDSWQVKKPSDDIVGRLPELADEGSENEVDEDGHPYCVRVFRIDSTFATLSAGPNTTVTQILEMLGRKSFLQEDLNNYDLVMRKNDLSRTLDHGERPILMQKRLLEQVGYKNSDRIADLGREDNSYLCRFTFLPTKLGVYAGLDSDLGFTDSQKFSHVDLHGRSIATIPLKLYKRASEIISLNLSRNLALDVPKDFIQSCINLREIRFTGNEAWHLPPSLGLASRLTYLDISNNRLEQLEHAELHKLKGLISLKMANNNLSKLPTRFGNFPSLRSLNISSNSFETLPEFLGQLDSLVDLDISFNQIKELPTIGHLMSLERLWVTNNKLSGPFGESFRGLVNLKEIDARFNNIASIDNTTALPRLETLLVGHNNISTFSGSFDRLRTLLLDHCPVTEFHLTAPLPSLHSLNIASAKLVELKDSLFTNVPNLAKLILNKNHFVTLSPNVGSLRRLEHFSMAKNPLSNLPSTIGCLAELKTLNLRECNLSKLPSELWCCLKLETLNVSSNLLDTFPGPAFVPPQLPSDPHLDTLTSSGTPALSSPQSYEELGKLGDFEARRPSQASGGRLHSSTPPSDSTRKGSFTSTHGSGGRKQSIASRSATDNSRKDSTLSQRTANTFASSLRQLYIADNQLEDDIFHQLVLLTEVRVLNLSYNSLTELPQGFIRRLQYLSELYLSGNELSALPSDDLEESSNLKVLHLNANKFQVLPAELCKVNKLAVLDVGSNSLKYNVSNWPYDWNWNWNHNLRYLNFSGNKRFEVKPNSSYTPGAGMNGTDLTNFNSLSYIRVLGLMDVTLTIPTIPDQTEDRRVRTSSSLSGYIAYGLADSLGKNEHLSIIDMVVPKFRGNEMETIIGLFDGQTSMSGGSKIAKFLHENFTTTFSGELRRLRRNKRETAEDALRRSFLALNKDMATAAYRPLDHRETRHWDRTPAAGNLLNRDDAYTGGVATILYLHNMDLFIANVGDATALLVQSSGQFKHLTRYHDPAEESERARIRKAGGYVSRNGKLNDQLSVSRAFGYFHLLPAVMAAPSTLRVTLSAQDEMIILASGHLWDYVSPEVVVDVARAERADLMTASQKIRDLAIAYGATNKLMVMIAGVSDLKRRERNKLRSTSLSMGPSPLSDEQMFPLTKRVKRRDIPGDSTLARLGHVEAPTGELAIIFTDIKKSTSLWETYPLAMRSAIQIHNDLFRRQLRLIGGFEVKTEGDAFMVSFSTATAALLWCFTCQVKLLEAQWPTEVLETPACRERYDEDGNVIFKGLSVRMGAHWGRPVCERDPVTGRMDYFGPMVNRASRISAVADGGQIFVSSDFVTEIQRTLEVFADTERNNSVASDDTFSDDVLNNNIRRELYQLSTQGFEVKDLGERKLKGLENPESVYLMYPHALAGRLAFQPEISDDVVPVPKTFGRNSKLNLDADQFWHLFRIALRLEAFCSALENPSSKIVQKPELQFLNTIKSRGGEITDSAVLNILEHQITRVETCTNTLAVRHMIHPFKPHDTLRDHAMPMSDILQQLKVQMMEFQALKAQVEVTDTGDRTFCASPASESNTEPSPHSGSTVMDVE